MLQYLHETMQAVRKRTHKEIEQRVCAKPWKSSCGSAGVAACWKLNVILCKLLKESFVLSNQMTKNGKTKQNVH